MNGVSFAFRRPLLLVQGFLADRNRPDLDRLAAIEDPMSFVWAILPHAARTYAMSILLLPATKARTAAVAYLYCRMLDTYEDLSEPINREAALEAFAARMTTLEPPPPAPTTAGDDRDRVHLLLVERYELVDRVFVRLTAADQEHVIALVQVMADGMVWSTRRFAEQGGVLVDAEQLSRYCHHVIGEPVLFALRSITGADLTAESRQDAFAVSELIQLANITRDIERDLARGIGYHPSLLPHLGRSDADGPVREARRHLMAHALPHASAYVRLTERFTTRRFSLARASSVLMLLHTDRHYDWCARRIGHPGWRGSGGMAKMMVASLFAAFSRRWSHRVMRQVENDLLSAATAIQAI